MNLSHTVRPLEATRVARHELVLAADEADD